MIKHLKEFWQRYFGYGIFAVIIGAMVTSQPNVTVSISPVVKWVSNTEIELVQPYSITTADWIVDFKQGFQSDGASEPRATWTALGLTPFSGASIDASLTHDGLTRAELLARTECNLIFRELLLKNGVVSNKAEAMYQAVERAGAMVWSKHTDATVQEARKFVSGKPRY